MKRYFHEELEELRNKLILLGEKTIEVARMAVEGYLEGDLEVIDKANQLDDQIDELENQISHDAVRYVTLRSPVSSDVRLIIVALKASRDFERAGDEAHSIARKAHKILTRDGRVHEPAGIARMSNLAFQMMKDAITCFVEEDIELAHEIIQRDRQVDQFNQDNFDFFFDTEATPELSAATRFETILISKSIERIADHSKNIAEEVIFLHTGE